MAASVKLPELKKAIKNILKDADLTSLSAKKVRRKLEEIFGFDFTERKKEIDELTMKMITEKGEDESDNDDDHSEEEESRQSKSSPRVTQNGKRKLSNDAGSDAESSHGSSEEEEPEPEPSPKKKKTQKKPAPAKPKSKKAPVTSPMLSDSGVSDDGEVDDEELAKKLQEEEDMNLRTRRRPQKRPAAPKKPKEKKERKGTSMYSRPCQLSPELADVLGEEQLSRHEIVKRMWEVMRNRNLQDPKNKQFMICDEELQKIFGRKRVRMFGMMKWLTKHIRNVDDTE